MAERKTQGNDQLLQQKNIKQKTGPLEKSREGRAPNLEIRAPTALLQTTDSCGERKKGTNQKLPFLAQEWPLLAVSKL